MPAIKIMLGKGNKPGPHSGYSGKGNPGRKSSHTTHDDPHEDEYDEAMYEAAENYASAMAAGDSRAILRTRRTLKRLEDYHEAMDED